MFACSRQARRRFLIYGQQMIHCMFVCLLSVLWRRNALCERPIHTPSDSFFLAGSFYLPKREASNFAGLSSPKKLFHLNLTPDADRLNFEPTWLFVSCGTLRASSVANDLAVACSRLKHLHVNNHRSVNEHEEDSRPAGRPNIEKAVDYQQHELIVLCCDKNQKRDNDRQQTF